MGTSTLTPTTNSLCIHCTKVMTVKVKTDAGYVCPMCYRQFTMNGEKVVARG